MSLLDIAPAVIDLAGGAPLPDCDGHSLVSTLRTGMEPCDRAVISEWITGATASGPITAG